KRARTGRTSPMSNAVIVAQCGARRSAYFAEAPSPACRCAHVALKAAGRRGSIEKKRCSVERQEPCSRVTLRLHGKPPTPLQPAEGRAPPRSESPQTADRRPPPLIRRRRTCAPGQCLRVLLFASTR